MAIADFATYLTKVAGAFQKVGIVKASLTTAAGRLTDLAGASGFPGAITTPTTATSVDRTLSGALGQLNSSSVQRLAQMELSYANGSAFLVYDRLLHLGGLDGTVTTAQPSPSAAASLTRYTNGLGNMLLAEVFTQVGATGTTITASYTNEGGTSGRTTQATDFGATGFREAARAMILPLQQGDTGVRNVSNCTLAGTTGTAGNFGLTIIHPLLLVPALNGTHFQQLYDAILNVGGSMPEIVSDACICFAIWNSPAATGLLNGTITLIEE